jgi:hypothetical protein
MQAGHTVGNEGFSIPNIGYPGIAPLLTVTGFSGATPVIEPISTTPGMPLNTTFPGVYSNLGVPTAIVAQLSGDPTMVLPTQAPFFDIVARPSAFDSMSVAGLAVMAQPTFVVVWAGNVDAMGAVIAGTPAALTATGVFEAGVEALLDTLETTGADLVMANIPDFSDITFTRSIPPIVVDPATGQPVEIPGVGTVPLLGQTDSGTPGPLDPASRVTLAASDSLAAGVGIPAQLPGGTGRPLPDSMVLTPNEITQISSAVDDYNDILAAAALARQIPLVDMHAFFAALLDDGFEVAGIEVNGDMVTGGGMSLDGLHPSTIGYGLITNEFINVINGHYGATLQPVNMAALLNVSSLPQQSPGDGACSFSTAAWRQLREQLGAGF